MLFSNAALGQVINKTLPGKADSVTHKPQHEPPEIVNVYTEVLSYDICTNSIAIANDSAFKVGDTVLLIQMKGAVIDTSNTASFGTVLNYKNAGNYEFNYISQISGNVFTFKNKLTKAYDIPGGVIQLIRVPSYTNAFFLGGLTCKAWDGVTGGVLAIISIGSLTCNDNIEVVGKGFRPGEGYNAILPSSNCFENNYNDPVSSQLAAFKGESIAVLSQNLVKGKGSPASGGGGGLSHNSGGGGGGNAGAGGYGGYQADTCGSAPFDNRGIGGKALLYTAAANKIFMGGGGGAGHADNFTTTLPPPAGGAGGGIVIILTDTLSMFDYQIFANGNSGTYCYSLDCSDGAGGGGGGGTVLLSTQKVVTPDGLNIQTSGGDGAFIIAPIVPGGKVGPGGGGGGGAFFTNTSSMPASVTVQNAGGMNGIIATNAANPWGAVPGTAGSNYFNLVLPFDNILFKPNIDSVRFTNTLNYCNYISFNGFGYVNSFPIASWSWDFGDGNSANTQNTSHNYGNVNTYNVKLIVTDINGCKDSIITPVFTGGAMSVDAGPDSTLCSSGQVSIQLNGNGTGLYSWSPAAFLNNPNIPNPVATISTTTKFYLTMSNGTGCSAIDSVLITINNNPVVKTLKDTSICLGATLILTTTGASTYNWSPGIYVSDSTIASPQFIDTVSRTLIVTGTNASGCIGRDTISITVKSRRIFLMPENKTICNGQSVQLDGRNGNNVSYQWTPTNYLSNSNIRNPIANPPVSTMYLVRIVEPACGYDTSFSSFVTVNPLPVLNASKSNDINCNLPFAHLNASGAVQYLWSPSIYLDNPSIRNPITNPPSTTKYYVTGTDSKGCSNKDSLDLIVDFSIPGFQLPNSFTPNRDGINDYFGIKYYRDVQDLVFIIYNRYGQKVFETNNAAITWDGNYKGQPADAGSYIWYLSAKTLCGYVVKKGSILLIR